MKKYN